MYNYFLIQIYCKKIFLFELNKILFCFRNEKYIDIDDQEKLKEDNLDKIHWAPMIKTIIPETFECLQQSDENLNLEQEKFIQDIRELIDETRITTLCCESVGFVLYKFFIFDFFFLKNSCNVVYWRLSIHHIVSKLYMLLNNHSNVN